jgi:hypothetical protein
MDGCGFPETDIHTDTFFWHNRPLRAENKKTVRHKTVWESSLIITYPVIFREVLAFPLAICPFV